MPSFSQVGWVVGSPRAGIFTMKTYAPKPDHVQRRWYVLDAEGQVLGRLATQAATLLRGKHKPTFAPHLDTGDHVIVVNADKVELTGDKRRTKIAYRHSGYPGGIRATSYDRLLSERPVAAVEKAIRGMLPKNRLGRAMIRKLHVVAGPEHPHAAQTPTALAAGERPAWEGLPVPRASAEAAPAKSPARRTSTSRPSAAPKPERATARASTAKASTAKRSTSAKRSTTAKRSSSAKRSTSKTASRTTSSSKRSSTARASRPKGGS